MIQAQNVWKHYGEHVVLERINIDVQPGEFVTLVGTSGCGKTTFLKMLLGTETASRGEILLDDKPIAQEPGADRGIVFQQYSVFSHMTVQQNVMAAFGFKTRGVTGRLFGAARSEAENKAKSMLERVGLDNAIHKYPHDLSGGMRQRLAIAQALLAQPRVLLLDEPFGALDPGIRGDMHVLVKELWAETQLTVFMVTHDLKEGFHLGSRLWVFDKTRYDPHAPEAYGATITYDLDTRENSSKVLPDVD